MIGFFLYFLLLEAASEAAKLVPASFPKGLMVDGNVVMIEEVPYVAIIQYKKWPICGGAIISENQILTSAHCVMSYSAWGERINYKVRIGSSSRNSTTDGRYLQIRDVKLHDFFTGIYESMYTNPHQVPVNDLAMIITEPMHFDAKIKPIPLFDEAEGLEPGTGALVTGWRRVNGSELLTTKTVSIRFKEDCKNEYNQGISAGQICASYPSGAWAKIACLGDLGGPLVVDGRFAGILSWGNGCASPYGYGVYTAIGYYRDWIDNGGRDVYRLPWTLQ